MKTIDEWFRWKGKIVTEVVKIAPNDDDFAFCPLCGEGVQGFTDSEPRGFRYPIGLEYHLEGSHRASQCAVMKTAWELARDQVMASMHP